MSFTEMNAEPREVLPAELGKEAEERQRETDILEGEEELVRKRREEFMKEHESDEILFAASVVLYRYNLESRSWGVRGKGKIRISVEPATGKQRILHVREKIFKLGCNHFITDAMSLEKYPLRDHSCMWVTYGDDCGDGQGRTQKFLAKFNNEEDYAGFRKHFLEGQKKNESISDGEKEPEEKHGKDEEKNAEGEEKREEENKK